MAGALGASYRGFESLYLDYNQPAGGHHNDPGPCTAENAVQGNMNEQSGSIVSSLAAYPVCRVRRYSVRRVRGVDTREAGRVPVKTAGS